MKEIREKVQYLERAMRCLCEELGVQVPGVLLKPQEPVTPVFPPIRGHSHRVPHVLINARTRWTVKEERRLEELQNEGFSLKECAVVFRRTHKAVLCRASILRLRSGGVTYTTPAGETKRRQRNWTPEDRKLLVDLRAKGYNTEYCSQELGRSEAAIITQIWRMTHGVGTQ